MRRVGREEAERVLRAAGASGPVRLVTVGEAWHDPTLLPPAPAAATATDVPELLHTYDAEDGASYTWEWSPAEAVRPGERLWCAGPHADVVVCVRERTALREPLPLRSRRGTLRLLRSRFATPPAPLLDAGVIAPADVTAGTGLTEEEALLVLRSRAAEERSGARHRVLGAFGVGVGGGAYIGPLGLDHGPLGVALLASLTLVPALLYAGVELGPGRAGRRRFEETFADGRLDVVVVEEWRSFGVTVATLDGRRFSWATRPDYGVRLATGSRAWATPLADGARVHLVGLGDGDGSPLVVEPDEPALEIRPPRSRIQDVVHPH